ncbi:hypothetical protein EOI86_05980 [Hwanghaeella grinnelliae]|uniref:Phytanoyl-CoA dioxygenase n=1 Tax=Hwanghaeella grinnelliae TaxID=2500179 RepID=A0A3S2W703_9PROT|nr:hypothetical protein [Hwanghaeella grinnelliae]RVU38814.1 hypothetical protein EOI86_05980 [Hwanghaeella grinnelliae]
MQVSSLLNPISRIQHWGLGNLVYSFTRQAGIPKDLRFTAVHCVRSLISPISTITRKRLARRYDKDAQMESSGYRFFSPKELPGSLEIANTCLAFYQSKQDIVDNMRDDTWSVDLLSPGGPSNNDGSILAIDAEAIPGLLDFALSDTIVSSAAAYLGTIPVISGITLYASLPNESLEGSQLYHCDIGDTRIFKCIVAVTDMTTDHGPFTFVSADQTEQIAKKFGPVTGRMSDEDVLSTSPDEISLLGERGGAIFIDTSRCLHYGSRGNTKTRVVLELQYRSATGIEGRWQRSRQTFDTSVCGNNQIKKLVAGLL